MATTPHDKMRDSTKRKYLAIQADYKTLYAEGLRNKIIIGRLMAKYFIEHEVTIWRILGTEVEPPEEQAAEAA